MNIMDLIQLISQGIAIIAVLIAIWQAYLSKQQLEKAKETRNNLKNYLGTLRTESKKLTAQNLFKNFSIQPVLESDGVKFSRQ
jgi:type II secretory pathway component PulC